MEVVERRRKRGRKRKREGRERRAKGKYSGGSGIDISDGR